MPAEPVDSSNADHLDPYAPPQADLNDHWGAGDPEMEEIRRAHLAEESYVKSLVILNCVYGLLFGCSFCSYYSYILAGHVTGRLSAPWIARPDWIALQIDHWCIVFIAIVAACGFRYRTKWACRAEALLVLCLFIVMSLGGFIIPLMNNTFELLTFTATSLFWLGLVTPIFNVWDIRKSVIFERGYRRVVAGTPHIKVKAKLPLDLKVFTVLLLTSSLVLAYLGSTTK